MTSAADVVWLPGQSAAGRYREYSRDVFTHLGAADGHSAAAELRAAGNYMKRDKQGPLRPDDEIIRAHDLLTFILTDSLLRDMIFEGPNSERDVAYAIRAAGRAAGFWSQAQRQLSKVDRPSGAQGSCSAWKWCGNEKADLHGDHGSPRRSHGGRSFRSPGSGWSHYGFAALQCGKDHRSELDDEGSGRGGMQLCHACASRAGLPTAAGVRSGFVDEKVERRCPRTGSGLRQLLRWTQIQMAMIEVGMVKPAEVFLPYAVGADGRTFYEYFEARQLLASAWNGDEAVIACPSCAALCAACWRSAAGPRGTGSRRGGGPGTSRNGGGVDQERAR